MKKNEFFLAEKLEKRGNLRRKLFPQGDFIDFSSNDYLGIAHNRSLEKEFLQYVAEKENWFGSTGSRLLTGNNEHIESLEFFLAEYFRGEAALSFGSGFSANSSLLAAVAQKGDCILYDELIHASLKEGYRLSFAERNSFKHNDLEDLEKKITAAKKTSKEIFVVTESVFSMDGDSPDLPTLLTLCEKHSALLILDEAHATGVFGENGGGLAVECGLEERIFARIYTFGKAGGCVGACLVGSALLRDFMINFGIGFIYTTAISPLIALQIEFALKFMAKNPELREKLHENIFFFKEKARDAGLTLCAESRSGIQMLACDSTEEAKEISTHLRENGFDVRPILPPTAKSPRLRVCLHAHNGIFEIENLIRTLKIALKK